MLTADLVRLRRNKGEAKLLREPADAAFVADALLAVARDPSHSCRASLMQALGAVETQDSKYRSGLIKVLLDACTFHTFDASAAADARRAVFSAAAAERKLGRFSREAVLARLAAERGVSQVSLEAALYGDLASNQRLTSCPKWSEDDLRRYYTEAALRGAHLHARAIRFSAHALPTKGLRKILRACRFFGLVPRQVSMDERQRQPDAPEVPTTDALTTDALITDALITDAKATGKSSKGKRRGKDPNAPSLGAMLIELCGVFEGAESSSKTGLALAQILPTLAAAGVRQTRARLHYRNDEAWLDADLTPLCQAEAFATTSAEALDQDGAVADLLASLASASVPVQQSRAIVRSHGGILLAPDFCFQSEGKPLVAVVVLDGPPSEARAYLSDLLARIGAGPELDVLFMHRGKGEQVTDLPPRVHVGRFHRTPTWDSIQRAMSLNS
jgi:predicted nuclease of restriction endonuclease-like RecB superfamily